MEERPQIEQPPTRLVDDRAGRRKRHLRGLAIALGCWTVLILAHLNLPKRVQVPPCSFPVTTGYPCPSCGMTRSMLAMSKGDVVAAFNRQPFGVILFPAVLIIAVAATVEALTGKNLLSKLRPGLWWVWAGLIGLMAGWIWVLVTGLRAGRLPIH